ncbi:MAG: YceI family protein [Clostridia bacterium]|nr:YceI family protein [Clostridia bacterium]
MSGERSRWVIDPSHTTVEFAVRHMMIATVKGRFGGIEGVIEADPSDLSTASVTATIDAASVDTRDAKRDEHLRSADFFDVANHPKITFASRRVAPKGGNRYELLGDLTIRGVTREVSLDLTFDGQAKDPWGNERAAFTAEGSLNRKDFGLNWNALLETGGVLVGDQVKITVYVEAVRQA